MGAHSAEVSPIYAAWITRDERSFIRVWIQSDPEAVRSLVEQTMREDRRIRLAVIKRHPGGKPVQFKDGVDLLSGTFDGATVRWKQPDTQEGLS